MFLVVVMAFTFFGPVTLEKADDLCGPNPITLECYKDALKPVQSANKDYNG